MADMRRRQFLLSSAAALAMPLPARAEAPLSVRIKHPTGWSITQHSSPEYIGSYAHTIGQHYRVASDVWEEALWDEPLPGQWKCTSPPTISGTVSEGETLTFTPGEWEIEDE